MKKKKFRKKYKKRKIEVGSCPFCKGDTLPDYKDALTLKKFVTERARILGSDLTGVCSKHQRSLAREIKRARHLGLLPFAPTLR